MLDAQGMAALECQWDILRLFGTRDIGDEGLMRGWSACEDSHVWNDGPEAHLRLILRGSPRRALLQIEGVPFIRPIQSQQDMTIYVNGYRLGLWRQSLAELTQISAWIEPEQMLIRGELVLLDCLFHLPDSIRPMDIGEGGDRRELGFCFQSVLVHDDSLG